MKRIFAMIGFVGLFSTMGLSSDQARTHPPRQTFSFEEDMRLRALVARCPLGGWGEIAVLMGNRNIRQCRDRWKHYLSATKRNVPWTIMEDQSLFEKYTEWGPKWTRIAAFLGDRTDTEVKNRWLKRFSYLEGGAIGFPRRANKQHNNPPLVPVTQAPAEPLQQNHILPILPDLPPQDPAPQTTNPPALDTFRIFEDDCSFSFDW
jgi:hypothetical protein